MKCEKAREIFSDHLEGLLERPMAVAFDQHIAECPSCTCEYNAFKATWNMLETLPEVMPPPGFAWDAVMKVRLQQEAEKRRQPKWQQVWNSLFLSRIPARAYAAAATAAVLAITVFQTPLRYEIGAFLVGKPAMTEPVTTQAEPNNAMHIGEIWQHSGLKFELGTSSSTDGTNVFQLVLRPDGVVSQDVKVFVLDPAHIAIGINGLVRNNQSLFDGRVDSRGQVVSFVWRDTDPKAVMGMLAEWKHKGRDFSEAIFVPTQLPSNNAEGRQNMMLESTDVYTAMKNISATYGVAILIDGDIRTKTRPVDVSNGTAEDALYQAISHLGLSWRLLGPDVYAIEHKIE